MNTIDYQTIRQSIKNGSDLRAPLMSIVDALEALDNAVEVKPKPELKKYTVPVTWRASGTMTIEAENFKQAKNIARIAPLPEEWEQVEDSFQIDDEVDRYDDEHWLVKEEEP